MVYWYAIINFMNPKLKRLEKTAFYLLLTLFLINTFTNVYLRTRILVVQKINLCYEKLESAYEVAGRDGLKKEYALILSRNSSNKNPFVQKFLRQVGESIDNSGNLDAYLHSTISAERKSIKDTRIAIILASIAVFILFMLRMLINFKITNRNKAKK